MEGLPIPSPTLQQPLGPPKKNSVHNVLSALQKQQLVKMKLENPKLTQSKLIEHAKELFGITPSMSQINRMLIGKEEFLRLRQEDGARKRNRGAKWPELEKAVDLWYNTMKSQGQADISDATLLKVAKEKAEELDIKPFSGSGGWLSNFKHRQGIRSHQLYQETDAADVLTSLAQSMMPADAEGGVKRANPDAVVESPEQPSSKKRGRPSKGKTGSPGEAAGLQGIESPEAATSAAHPMMDFPAFLVPSEGEQGGVIRVAIGFPAPTVQGHVAEDQALGISFFREGQPGEAGQQLPEEAGEENNAPQARTEDAPEETEAQPQTATLELSQPANADPVPPASAVLEQGGAAGSAKPEGHAEDSRPNPGPSLQ